MTVASEHLRRKLGIWSVGAFLSIAGLTVASPVIAQGYPNRPIRLVVPYPAGGPSDVVARPLAEFISKDLGQAVVVFNRAGADTILGADMAAKAAPDGYTLVLLGDSGIVNTASGRKLPYDLEKDLTPVSMAYSGPQVLMVSKDSQFKNLQDMVRFAKANPTKVTFAGFGGASAVTLSSEAFNQAAGIDALQVSYRGMAAAQMDLIGGRIDYILGGTTAAIPAIAGGKVRGLAIMSKQRSPLLADVPTAIEQGVNVETAGWFGIFATAGSPPDAIRTVHASMMRALESKVVSETYQKQGGSPMPMSPEQFQAFLRSELQRLGVLMKRLDIKFD